MNKTKEIFTKVNSSKQVLKYLHEVATNSYRPTHTGIVSILNTIPYFIFCKGETLCLASLSVLLNWQHQFDKTNLILDDIEIASVASDIINYCYGIKMNKKDTIFNRFFDDIIKINEEAEKNTNSLYWADSDDFDYGERLD